MTRFQEVQAQLKLAPKKWLVTGCAGFIGSNLVETLLLLNQQVVGLDNFATGHQHNLDEVESLVTSEQWERFSFIEGDIRKLDDCKQACGGVDFVLHEAALGSVPRSLEDPVTTNSVNIDGFLNMLIAARDAKVKRLVYAASSSTYGDHPGLPKVEDIIGVETKFVPDCIGEEAEKAVANLKPGEILILENLRFHTEETEGNKEFAEKLSKLGDIYVNDAFGTAHRAHASTSIIADFFPENKSIYVVSEKNYEGLLFTHGVKYHEWKC